MRLAPPSVEAMSEEQRAVHQRIVSGPRGSVRGPLAIWLHRPELADSAQALGAYCRYGSSLAPRLSELAILTTARLWTSEFEWWAHKRVGIEAGLDPALVEALRRGEIPRFTDPEEETVHAVVVTLNEARSLPASLYERALEILGAGRLVDLVGLCGYYTLISMTINAFDIPIPEGAEAELG